MKSFTKTYLSIGSNLGDKLNNLQKAITQIHCDIGSVDCVSKVYSSESWGFDGENFYNCCILVSTILTPFQCLKACQQIEKKIGRQSKQKSTFEDRIIDIDLLWMGEITVQTEQLVLPHPSIAQRNFVLAPLIDIAATEIYPTAMKSISELFKNSKDRVTAVAIPDQLIKPNLPFINFSYVAIEGNIGAGKTSLASMIAEDYNAKFIPERFKDNPFLPKFYKDQSRYAFPLEMSFLADRHQQLLDDISQFDLFSEFVVADYDIYKSLIFARVTLGEDEYHLYKKVFDIMYNDLPKPDLYIYLYQNTERLLENIKKRGRSYEQEIPSEYLENINKGYLNFIKSQQHLNIKIIDISEFDFVNNRKDYLYLLAEISIAQK